MNHASKITLALVLIGLFSLSSGACSKVPREKACFKDTCISVEIADSGPERSRGLMFRKSMPQNAGMLFVYDKDVQCSMWMKNTRFPLDMLWIDHDKKVVDIKKNISPCISLPCEVYRSEAYVLYVLEVNAGFTDKYHIAVGDTIEITQP